MTPCKFSHPPKAQRDDPSTPGSAPEQVCRRLEKALSGHRDLHGATSRDSRNLHHAMRVFASPQQLTEMIPAPLEAPPCSLGGGSGSLLEATEGPTGPPRGIHETRMASCKLCEFVEVALWSTSERFEVCWEHLGEVLKASQALVEVLVGC